MFGLYCTVLILPLLIFPFLRIDDGRFYGTLAVSGYQKAIDRRYFLYLQYDISSKYLDTFNFCVNAII